MPKLTLSNKKKEKSSKKPKKVKQKKTKKHVSTDSSDDFDLLNNCEDEDSTTSEADEEINKNDLKNLNIEKIQKEIMKDKYNKICNNIIENSKLLNCSKEDKKIISKIVYYYIKFFLYTSSIKNKPILEWLEEFKNKITIR